MGDVIVAGAGMTRFGKFPDRGVRSLATEAVQDALSDAGLAAADVEMVFFANAMAGLITGQEMIRGQSALRETGLLGRPIVNVENACASSSTAAHLAWMAVASGQVEVALAVGSEKMTHPDKGRTFAALAAARDLDEPGNEVEDGGTHSTFMDIYAESARAYLAERGATSADLANVVVKARRLGSLNDRAQFREAVSPDDVLRSRMISDPLTLLMCSPIGDGAAAVVFCSPERARSLDVAPVRVAASVLVSGDPRGAGAVHAAIGRAWERSGFGPQDLDVVELHDAAAPAELIGYEDIGLCAPGESTELLAAGDTDLGGRVPVNTSGGLISRGHPVGATGCAQLYELTQQLRGRCGDRQVQGARVGLAENAGGSLGPDAAAAAVTILTVA